MGDQTRIIVKDLKKPVSGTAYGSKTLFDVASHNEAIKPELIVFAHLSNTLTTSTITSHAMNVNATSTAAQTFYFQNQTTTTFHLTSVHILIVDSKIDPTDFGGITGGITNGVKIEIIDATSTVLTDFTGNEPIKINSEFSFLAGGNVNLHVGTGDDALHVDWSMARTGGQVQLTAGQRICFTIRDNLTALTSFRSHVQGHYEF